MNTVAQFSDRLCGAGPSDGVIAERRDGIANRCGQWESGLVTGAVDPATGQRLTRTATWPRRRAGQVWTDRRAHGRQTGGSVAAIPSGHCGQSPRYVQKQPQHALVGAIGWPGADPAQQAAHRSTLPQRMDLAELRPDVNALIKMGLLVRLPGKLVRARIEVVNAFLPLVADSAS